METKRLEDLSNINFDEELEDYEDKSKKLYLIENIGGIGSSSSVARLIMHQKNTNENENLPFTIVEENDDESDKKE